MVKRPVVIGGDAAHAGAPTLAQGAAMAILDAIVLAGEPKNPRRSRNSFTGPTSKEERSKSRTYPQKSSAAG
ncbi:FAD binding domain-containing protein [Bacillus sp. JS]|nr:FAD binding domain-containing protein [Bacillus sp. JS]